MCTQKTLTWICLSGVLGVAACQGYPFVFQTNQRVGSRHYEVAVQTEGKADILFVIDNSGSMAEEQQKLKDNMSAFIEVLTNSIIDYQVGVISTDVVRVPTSPECQPCCDLDTDADGVPDWSNCDGGRLVSGDGRTRIFRRPSDADPTQTEILKQQLIQDFNAAVTALGTEGSAFETPFSALRRAVDPDADFAVRAINWGFLRPDADLAVIFLSDEDACEYPADWYADPFRDDADCYTGVNPTSVAELLDFLASVKGGIRGIRAASIVGAAPSELDANGLDALPAGCITVNNPGAADDGLASNACGCWSARYLPDRRPGQTGDFYCNYLAAPPFEQLTSRVPDLGSSQGGCMTMPGSRYHEFLTTLAERRRAAGYDAGVLIDSICRADYRQTLERIAINLIIGNCFTLSEPPDLTRLSDILVTLNGVSLPKVEHLGTEPGWGYDAEMNRICLEGGLTKKVGDVIDISVITDVVGFDSGSAAVAADSTPADASFSD